MNRKRCFFVAVSYVWGSNETTICKNIYKYIFDINLYQTNCDRQSKFWDIVLY